jgi:hypothetical protein
VLGGARVAAQLGDPDDRHRQRQHANDDASNPTHNANGMPTTDPAAHVGVGPW